MARDEDEECVFANLFLRLDEDVHFLGVDTRCDPDRAVSDM